MSRGDQGAGGADPHAGFQRRIRLVPQAGRIVAGLEDNLHRFIMTLSHDGGLVTDVAVEAERYPWTTCGDAPAFLRTEIVGKSLALLAELDCFQHCTHLFELAVLCAAHARDVAPVQFDLHVAEWAENRTRVRLSIDGRPVGDIAVHGATVETPGAWFGRDMMRLPQWRDQLGAAEAEQAMLMARAIYVSLGRISQVVDRASERGPSVIGVCYSYQRRRVDQAIRVPHSRMEFPAGLGDPLRGFDLKSHAG